MAPYASVELFTTSLRTMLSGAPAAASRFIVPITLISCRVRPVWRVESTIRWVWRIVSMPAALTIRLRIEYDESVRTNSVRSIGRRGSVVSTPITTSTSSSASTCWARRLPQNVPRPVMRTRIPTAAQPLHTLCRWRSMS